MTETQYEVCSLGGIVTFGDQLDAMVEADRCAVEEGMAIVIEVAKRDGRKYRIVCYQAFKR